MTNNFIKDRFTPLSIACAVAASPFFAVNSVYAQDDKEWAIEEVVVTARRKQESLQDVPTSVTALAKNDLEALKIDGFQAVGQTVPNLYIQKQGGVPATPQMQIRGISNGSLNYQVDSGIGMYVDGVYLGRASGAAFEMADLERVEVLRGPQGTLFGRNSTGGAINLITAVPSGELYTKVEAGVGNYRMQRYKFTADLPDWNGFKARVNVSHREERGDVKNSSQKRTFNFPEPFGSITTSDRGGDNDTDGLFFALRYDGIERLIVDYKYDQSNWNGTMNYRQVGNVGPCVDPAITPGECTLRDGSVREVVPVSESFGYESRQAVPLEGESSLDVKGHSLTVEYALTDALTVKYIGGYRESDMFTAGNQVWGGGEYINDGALPGPVGGVYAPLFGLRLESQQQASHEIQLLGYAGSVDWIVGAFYFDEDGSVNNPILLSRAIGDTSIIDVNPISVAGYDYFVGQNYRVNNKSEAYYAHATYTFGDFALSGGVRYTEDDRSEDVIAAGLIGLATPSAKFNTTGNHTDYSTSLTYNFDDFSNVYFKYATGFVSGGTLFGNSFGEEEVESYELGMKSDFMDRRLRVNAALFTQERSDVQIEGFTGAGYFMGLGRDVSADGLELEVTYLPTAQVKLNASYGYTSVDSSGDLRTYQPKNTAYVGAQYDFNVWSNGARPMARLDVSWRDKTYRLACTAGMDQVPASDVCVGTPDQSLDDRAELTATTQVGAQFSIADIPVGDSYAKVTFWGRNLLDQDEMEFNYTLGGPTISSIFMRPRTFGVDFSVEF